MAANKSGLHLAAAEIPLVLGMVARGDRRHDSAAWFGVNQGRIAEAQNGKFGTPPIAPPHALPPTGPPGIKGRRIRHALDGAIALAKKGDLAGVKAALAAAASAFDQHEP
jgi:hypothetical protein